MKLNLLEHWQKFYDIYAIGILTIVGLLLRLPGLNLGLWRDEGSTYFDTLPDSFGEIISRVVYSELNPPVFFLLMAQWLRWFGSEAVTFKIPALIFGLLLIGATYLLGREIGSRSVGIVAATLATFAPQAIYFAQEARPYTLAGLLSCLTVLMYCKSLNFQHQKVAICGFIICATTLIYVQYTGLLLVGTLFINTLYLIRSGKTKLPWQSSAISFGAIFLMFLPWLPIFLAHRSIGSPWLDKIPLLMRWKLLPYNFLYSLPEDTLLREILKYPILGAISLLMWQLLLSRSNRSQLRWDINLNAKISTLISGIMLPTIFVSLLSYSGHYLFFVLPMSWVLYSIWLVKLWNWLLQHSIDRGQKLALSAMLGLPILLLFVIPSLLYPLSLGTVHKSGIRPLVADLVAEPLTRNTLYLLSPDYLAPTFGYYTAQLPVRFHGFARWQQPEIFSPQGYVELWQLPGNVAKTLKRIQSAADRYQLLALVSIDRIQDGGNMPYGKSNQLLSKLKARYPLLSQKYYPGTKESVTLYQFDLTVTTN